MTGTILNFVNYEVFLCYFTGSFGNGVLSYFTFLKWLLWLNIYVFILTLCFVIIPQALSSGEELPLTITAQNASAFTSNSSSSSTVVPANVTASSPARKKREVFLNKSEEEDNDLKCNLVKPYNYSSYTNKPFPQLLSDFISGIVSIGGTPYLKKTRKAQWPYGLCARLRVETWLWAKHQHLLSQWPSPPKSTNGCWWIVREAWWNARG